MKIALYTRVSTDEQAREGTSLEVQRERLEACVQQNGWEAFYPEANKIYVDDGYSGSSLDRPALKRLVKDAKLGKFNVLLVYKIDRLSRKAQDLLNLCAEFKDIGVEIKSATEPFDSSGLGNAMFQIAGVFAELERARMIERIVPGMKKSIEKGNWHGARYSPIGYKYNKQTKLLEIVPEQVEIVRLIYTMYLSNQSSVQVAKYLNEKGYKTPNGKKFGSKFICDILKNKMYLGRLVWNKNHYDKKQKTKKGFKYVKNPSSEVMDVIGKQATIISLDEFELVQKKLARNRRGSLHRNTANFYPLTGVIDCADCGHRFCGKFNVSNHRTGEKKRWYVCNAKHAFGVNCSNGGVKAEDLEPKIFLVFKALLEHPDIRNGRISGLTIEGNQKKDTELSDAKEALESDLKENHRQQKSNNDSHLEGFLTRDVFKESMLELRIKEEKIVSDIRKIDAQLLERQNSEAYQKTLVRVLADFDKTREVIDHITQKELIRLVVKRILIKDTKIVKLELHQPFERYLKELKCNVNLIMTSSSENSSLLKPTAAA